MAEIVIMNLQDTNLRDTLRFGIGLHHAGLNEHDRSTAERLFVEGKIKILVATSTLAWGVNTPAHLVVIKGTEFFDAPTGYVTEPYPQIGTVGLKIVAAMLYMKSCSLAGRIFPTTLSVLFLKAVMKFSALLRRSMLHCMFCIYWWRKANEVNTRTRSSSFSW